MSQNKKREMRDRSLSIDGDAGIYSRSLWRCSWWWVKKKERNRTVVIMRRLMERIDNYWYAKNLSINGVVSNGSSWWWWRRGTRGKERLWLWGKLSTSNYVYAKTKMHHPSQSRWSQATCHHPPPAAGTPDTPRSGIINLILVCQKAILHPCFFKYPDETRRAKPILKLLSILSYV